MISLVKMWLHNKAKLIFKTLYYPHSPFFFSPHRPPLLVPQDKKLKATTTQKRQKWFSKWWGPHSHALFFSSLCWPQFTQETQWQERIKLGNRTRVGKGRHGWIMEAIVDPGNISWTQQQSIHFRLVNFLCSFLLLLLHLLKGAIFFSATWISEVLVSVLFLSYLPISL